MISQDEMTESKMVAIWIGNHADEIEFEDYLEDRFEDDFGFMITHQRGPEMDCHPNPIPVKNLLGAFSMCEHWIAPALEKCAEMGIYEASSALVFHFLNYDLSKCKPEHSEKMQLIGNFSWE